MQQTLLDDLYADWRHCRQDPAVKRWLRTQTETEPAFCGIHTMAALEVIVQDRSEPLHVVDGVLSALLRRCQDGDEIAGRVLLGLMLPAMTPPVWHPNGSEEFVAQFVTELWHVIRRYPIERRPRSIAANIVRDTRQRTHRAFTPAASEPTATVRLPAQLPQRERACPYELAEGRADLRRAVSCAALDAGDLALIAVTRLGGARLTELATGSEALAFVLALCTESKTHAPLIADSLLNFMSGAVRRNTLRVTAQNSSQPILLLTNSDLEAPSEIETVTQYAGATYTLTGQWDAIEAGDGGDVVHWSEQRQVSLLCACGPRQYCDICERIGQAGAPGWQRRV